MGCLEEADERNWQLQLNVIFVREEGVDAGGLTREFFSLLFKTTGVFDNENFSVRADLLKKKTYHILGRITANAIILGHPGPRCLNAHIANYIINSKEPDIDNVQIRDLPGDAAAAVQQVYFISSIILYINIYIMYYRNIHAILIFFSNLKRICSPPLTGVQVIKSN